MDEHYIITIVYSIDEIDRFTQLYLGATFDYTYLAEPNKDFMTFDMEKREITFITGGAGGGYNYSIKELKELGDGQYSVKYLAVDPYVKDAIAKGCYYSGTITFKIADGHIVLLSHSSDRL